MTETSWLIALIVFDAIVVPVAVVLLIKGHRKKGTFCAADFGVDDQITLDVLHTADIAKWCVDQKLKAGDSCVVIGMASGRFDLKKMPRALRKVADRAYMLIAQDENRKRLRTCMVICNTAEEALTRELTDGDGVFILEI